MRTITFYSYKGGVGRTLAATNFAVYLAKLRQRTVILDFDLEAPGVDSKFPGLAVPVNHRGILDYVLEYQQSGGNPGEVRRLALEVSGATIGNTAPLWVIPAGDYLSPTYYRRLNQLEWNLIFSDSRNGVAFFQNLIRRIEEEFQADFLIIDSRTGMGEIAALCTQQLPDEVVVISSLASESIKVTKHIRELIRSSTIADALGKSIDVKVVVSRIPKPENLEDLKERSSEIFGVDASKLFFLFSSPALEREEFIALASDTERDGELVAGYVRLFYGLNVQVADENIRAEIDRAARGLLTKSPEESEKAISELVALYPHPEAFRTAMRFFRLVNKPDRMRAAAWRLLDFAPDDEEAEENLVASYLNNRPEMNDIREKRNAVRALERRFRKGQLDQRAKGVLASNLEDLQRFPEAFDVASKLAAEEGPQDEIRIRARTIAARSALRLKNEAAARELVDKIPTGWLGGQLARLAIEMRREAGDETAAFDLSLDVLRRSLDPSLILTAGRLARRLERVPDLEAAIRGSEEFSTIKIRRPFVANDVSDALRRAGLAQVARELP
jgi:hypothetical protein